MNPGGGQIRPSRRATMSAENIVPFSNATDLAWDPPTDGGRGGKPKVVPPLLYKGTFGVAGLAVSIPDTEAFRRPENMSQICC